MASRTELYQITRELRRYLAWQAQGGAPGVLPASAAEREAWQEIQTEREAQRAQAKRAELFGEDRLSARAREPERAVPGARADVERSQGLGGQGSPDVQAAKSVPASPSAGDVTQLWNTLGRQSRRTFQEEEAVPVQKLPETSAKQVSGREQVGERTKQVEKQQHSSVSSVNSAAADDFGGYDEQYIDYSEQYSEIDASMYMPPVVEKVERPVRRVEMTNAEKLDFLQKYLGDCRRCALHQGRTQVVFGDGNPQARLMFVGEGPGVEEDLAGVPFVGEAGALLDRMIAAMGFRREDVYVASVVKCRSAENRNPIESEVGECSPFLLKQIEAVRPEVIVTLGGLAAQTLLGDRAKLTQMRGRWHAWKEIPVMPTYNPKLLLKNERLKRDAWNDLQMVMARLGETK